MGSEIILSTAQLDFLKAELCSFPALSGMREDILLAYAALSDTFAHGGKLLICGNGGSAADADHIVAELMKGFEKKRQLPDDTVAKLLEYPEGESLSGVLQGALPAINLSAHTALLTAFSNDVSYAGAFAQQVIGYGNPGDTLLSISTSGCSENIVLACIAARAAGMKVIALTGEKGGRVAELSDAAIRAPGGTARQIQDVHSAAYHILCVLLEMKFWPD